MSSDCRKIITALLRENLKPHFVQTFTETSLFFEEGRVSDVSDYAFQDGFRINLFQFLCELDSSRLD